MSIPKKGSRKITVAGIHYRWRVSTYRRISEWRTESSILDERYAVLAQKYGLGDVADVVFNIPIELYSDPVSKILIKYFGLVVDGFLGIEQMTRIRPSLIRTVIEQALAHGWNAEKKGDVRVEIIENTGQPHRPALLVLPGTATDLEAYEPQVKLIQIA